MNNEDQQVGQLNEHNGDPSIFIVIIIAGVCSKEDCEVAHPGIRKPNVHNQPLHRYCIFYLMLYTHMLNISSILSCCIHTSYWNIQHLEYFNNPTPPHSATPVWVLHQDGIWRLLNRVYMNTSSDTSFSSNIYFVLVSENHCHRDHMSSSASK